MSRATQTIRLAIAAVFLLPVATPAHAADPAHDPVVDCHYWRQAATLVFSATAYVVTAHVPPSSISVVCRFKNSSAWYSTYNSGPGPVTNSTGAGPQIAGAMTVCGYAVATYADGHTGTGTMGAQPC
jgi:hypothetical protein